MSWGGGGGGLKPYINVALLFIQHHQCLKKQVKSSSIVSHPFIHQRGGGYIDNKSLKDNSLSKDKHLLSGDNSPSKDRLLPKGENSDDILFFPKKKKQKTLP